MPSDETPRLLYRSQLPDLFHEHGLPRPSLSYLNKLACLGEGPLPASFWGPRPLYEASAAVAWFRDRIAEQTKAAIERQEQNRQSRLRRLERLQRQAVAARGSAAA